MELNLFERATRLAFRFTSVRGLLTTEQLWDLPLTARDNFDLDSVAKAVFSDVKASEETSFVATKTNPNKVLNGDRLEVVKRIIEVKIAERDAKTQAAANATEAAQLREILQTKKAAKLENLSEEEIERRLAALRT